MCSKSAVTTQKGIMNEAILSHNRWYIPIYISYTKCNIGYETAVVLCKLCLKSMEIEAVLIR